MRKVTRHVRVRALAGTEAFEQSRRERKKVEMRFAHMKRILRLDAFDCVASVTRGASAAHRNRAEPERLAKFLCRPPPLEERRRTWSSA